MSEGFSNKIGRAVYGVGYNSNPRGNGYPTKNGEVITKAYDHWRRFLCRSYSVEWKDKHPTYSDTYVCNDWHDYQLFAKWYHGQNYSANVNYDLDKDLLVLGNNIYSPETCVLIPNELNKAIVIRGNVATFHRRDKCYEASCNGKYIGRSESDPLAFKDKWLELKHLHIQKLANKYKDSISRAAYDALINFRVGIIDSLGSVRRIS